jgi:hypothetical protein
LQPKSMVAYYSVAMRGFWIVVFKLFSRHAHHI